MAREVWAVTWKYGAASFSLYNSNNVHKLHRRFRHPITYLLAGRAYMCTVFFTSPCHRIQQGPLADSGTTSRFSTLVQSISYILSSSV